jgi:hypothetical protein
MGKRLLWAIIASVTLVISPSIGCKSDDGDDEATDAGTSGGNGEPLNDACPNLVGPRTGKYAARGECCRREKNSTRVEAQGDGDAVTVEYRLNHIQTTNHPKTIGQDLIRTLTMGRLDGEQQSVLWRITGPRENGDIASGRGQTEIGSGRYNCDGTYSYYSDKAAPNTPSHTDPSRWERPVVPVTINADIKEADRAQERVVPDFATNANRGYTYTPYVAATAEKGDPNYRLDWELVNQGFMIESLPTEPEALDCIGSRSEDGNGWVKGGTFIVYTPLGVNNTDPIPDLVGQTYCQLVAFGVIAGMKDLPEYDCETAKRCKPGTKVDGEDCQWVKLPDSLCPVTDDEKDMWGCHVGDENNEDGEPTNCTAEEPTEPLDPAKGATSLGQCCDPLGESKTLPACNAYFLRNEYVAAAAEITDKPADSLPPNCAKIE